MWKGDYCGFTHAYDPGVSKAHGDPLWRRIDCTNRLRAILSRENMDAKLINSARYCEEAYDADPRIVLCTIEIPLTERAWAEVGGRA